MRCHRLIIVVLLDACLLSMASLYIEALEGESGIEIRPATRSPRPQRHSFENSHKGGGGSEDDLDWAHLLDVHSPRHEMHEPQLREIGPESHIRFDRPKPIRKCRSHFQERRGDYRHVKLPWMAGGPLFRGEEAWPDDFPRRRPYGHHQAPQHSGMPWDRQGRREQHRGWPEQRLQDADTPSHPTSSPTEKHDKTIETSKKTGSTEVSFAEGSKSQSAPSATSEKDKPAQVSISDSTSSQVKVSGESKDSRASDSHEAGATRSISSDGVKVAPENTHKEESQPPRPANPRIRDRNMRRDKDGLFGHDSFGHP